MVSESQKALAFATLMPGATCVAGYAAYYLAGDFRAYYRDAKKPSWIGDAEVPYMVADIVSLVGPAVAAYRVYKLGGFNYDDTRTALGLYAAMHLLGGSATIYAMTQKSFAKGVWSNVLYAGLAQATLLAMLNVDKKAGLYTLPFAFWTVIGLLFTVSMSHENPEK